MSNAFVFGYGSLVNRRTHDMAEAYPARISGWRRAWAHTGLREVAFLTAVPDPGAEIEGLVAAIPGGDWAALDAREWAYDRHAADDRVSHGAGRALQVSVYAVAPERSAPPSVRHPVLLSYLDAVVQGYLAEYGEGGVVRFFDTTDGWEAPILNDRPTPRYPRAQVLSPDERAFVDDQIARVGGRVVAG